MSTHTTIQQTCIKCHTLYPNENLKCICGEENPMAVDPTAKKNDLLTTTEKNKKKEEKQNEEKNKKKEEKKNEFKDGELSVEEKDFIQTASLVVVSGLQGSGKTTKAKKISDYLRSQGKRIEVIPPLEFMSRGGYIDLYQTSKVKENRDNLVDRMVNAKNRGGFDVMIVVFSLNSKMGRKTFKDFAFRDCKYKEFVEFNSTTDKDLSMIMGISATMKIQEDKISDYTVAKHIRSIKRGSDWNANDEEKHSIRRSKMFLFSIDSYVSDDELQARLELISNSNEYLALKKHLSKTTEFGRRAWALIDKIDKIDALDQAVEGITGGIGNVIINNS